MAAEYTPLFLALGVLGAWGAGRWGLVVVAVPVVLFWRSLVFDSQTDSAMRNGIELDPFIPSPHTSSAVAWTAVVLTIVGFLVGRYSSTVRTQ